jgi:hypothetical protein
MPTNVYFDTGTKPEQNLYEDLIIEQLRIYGQDCYYIPRNMVRDDKVFGEDSLSKFEDAYISVMDVDNVDGYEGEKELMSKFGLDIQDDATFTVARRRWEQFVTVDNNLIVSSRPNEGDLVYWPKGSKLFEITFVDHDDPFYAVHNLPTYKLKCKTFEYSSEELDTGIAEIDAIEDANSLDQLSHQMTLENATTFTENFALEQGTPSDGLLVLEDSLLGDNIISESVDNIGSIVLENNVEDALASYIILETYRVDTIDEGAQNDLFDSEEDTILDFTESNPFGDAGK